MGDESAVRVVLLVYGIVIGWVGKAYLEDFVEHRTWRALRERERQAAELAKFDEEQLEREDEKEIILGPEPKAKEPSTASS